MSAGASHVCIRIGIADRIAITTMVTAKNLPIAPRLRPHHGRIIASGFHERSVWKRQRNDQAKQIDATRQDLASTRTELKGSIATTHDELVLLEKKGERSYYEFDLDKSKQFERKGPVGVRLAKANTKHEFADLEMMVDDLKVSKKHVNIYEPVMFYAADSKRPIEVVINAISKNHIHGYVSEPKYKGSDLEAAANSPVTNVAEGANGTPADVNAKPSPARQRLDSPNKN